MQKHHPDCPHSVLSDSIIIRNSMYPCKYCDVAEAAAERAILEEDKMIPIIRRNEYERGYERAKSDLRHMVPDAYNDGYFEGYEAGYDSALKNHVCENPCAEIPTPEPAYRESYFNQHGQGENP